MNRLHNIKKKLLELKTLDTDYTVFGSKSHEYKFDIPIELEKLQQYETNHNLSLPQEYREFLLTVSNGGVGPFYGLLALNYNEDQACNPSKEFPLTEGLNLDITEIWFKDYLDSKGIDEVEMTEAQEDVFYELRDTKLNDLYDHVTQGITFLAHEGCGMFSVLVLKGKAYGQVWFFDLVNDVGVFPLKNKDNSNMTFFDWYELWLDAALESFNDTNSTILTTYLEHIKKT